MYVDLVPRHTGGLKNGEANLRWPHIRTGNDRTPRRAFGVAFRFIIMNSTYVKSIFTAWTAWLSPYFASVAQDTLGPFREVRIRIVAGGTERVFKCDTRWTMDEALEEIYFEYGLDGVILSENGEMLRLGDGDVLPAGTLLFQEISVHAPISDQGE